MVIINVAFVGFTMIISLGEKMGRNLILNCAPAVESSLVKKMLL